MPYRDAWAEQERVHEGVVNGAEEQILLVEHPPVVTLGRRPDVVRILIATPQQLAARGVELVETDRGGDVTFHGPGQLVAYPIVRLIDHKLSVGGYVHRLEDAIIATVERFGIKTVVNLQHEAPDPLLPDNWLGEGKVRESELCAQLGVRYRLLTPDVLPPGNQLDWEPPAVKQWRDLLDDESNYPVLLHCKAGLHRTGRLTAIYRMEYRGGAPGEALRELRANGYGYVAASEGDEFVIQFVQNYKPRSKAERLVAGGAARVAEGVATAGGPRP